MANLKQQEEDEWYDEGQKCGKPDGNDVFAKLSSAYRPYWQPTGYANWG
jgi:hypothetical protein